MPKYKYKRNESNAKINKTNIVFYMICVGRHELNNILLCRWKAIPAILFYLTVRLCWKNLCFMIYFQLVRTHMMGPMLELHFTNVFLAHVWVCLSKSRFWKEKVPKFILSFLNLDKMDNIAAHVSIAFHEPMIPHVALALGESLFACNRATTACLIHVSTKYYHVEHVL